MIRKCPNKWGGNQRLRILFDSGCGATLINKIFVTNWKKSREKSTKWSTKAGTSFKIYSTSISHKIETSLVRPMWKNHHIRIAPLSYSHWERSLAFLGNQPPV